MRPAISNGCQEFFFVFSYQLDECLVADIFVRSGPEDHFSEDRREIDSFWRERINLLAPVRRISFGGDNSMSFELTQTVGQDVRRNFLVGLEEFLEGPESPQHHVANNQ